jgi:hypothetical protein
MDRMPHVQSKKRITYSGQVSTLVTGPRWRLNEHVVPSFYHSSPSAGGTTLHTTRGTRHHIYKHNHHHALPACLMSMSNNTGPDPTSKNTRGKCDKSAPTAPASTCTSRTGHVAHREKIHPCPFRSGDGALDAHEQGPASRHLDDLPHAHSSRRPIRRHRFGHPRGVRSTPNHVQQSLPQCHIRLEPDGPIRRRPMSTTVPSRMCQ